MYPIPGLDCGLISGDNHSDCGGYEGEKLESKSRDGDVLKLSKDHIMWGWVILYTNGEKKTTQCI